MSKNFEKLMKHYNQFNKMGQIGSILSFDQQVNMPSSGSEYRGELLELVSINLAKSLKSGRLNGLIHHAKHEANQEIIVEELKEEANNHLLIIEDIEESVKFSKRIPVSLHGKLSKLQSKCNAEWEKVKTKQANDKKYLKILEQYIKAIKESIKYANQGEYETPYDYLLAGYSKGFKAKDIETIFGKLKPFILEAHKKTKKLEEKEFFASNVRVMEVGQKIAEKIIGSKNFKLQESTHPFCTTLGLNDVRITTRIKSGNILDSIGSVVHESGHATYELGLPKENYGNRLGSAASIACHEGISLFYEKHLGESLIMMKTLSEEFEVEESDIFNWMRSVDSENPIRTESDEITYQLHIINRFTIENEIFNGDLKVKDIPKRWNELYGKEFTPELGHSQDVHWSHGSFGYFPSYTLGHLIAAQLKNKMSGEIEMFKDNEINFDGIREWLSKNYFKYGGKYESNALVVNATGEQLNPEYWMEYIKNKFNL